MNLAVEKKVQQLLNYIQKLTQPAIGEMQARMLVDLSGTLRRAIDNLQCTWAIKRDELHRQDLDMVSQSVSERPSAPGKRLYVRPKHSSSRGILADNHPVAWPRTRRKESTNSTTP